MLLSECLWMHNCTQQKIAWAISAETMPKGDNDCFVLALVSKENDWCMSGKIPATVGGGGVNDKWTEIGLDEFIQAGALTDQGRIWYRKLM